MHLFKAKTNIMHLIETSNGIAFDILILWIIKLWATIWHCDGKIKTFNKLKFVI